MSPNKQNQYNPRFYEESNMGAGSNYGRQQSENVNSSFIAKYGKPYQQEENVYNPQGGGAASGGLRRSPYHSNSTAEIQQIPAQDGEKTSVKVYNPPGGKSSLNLGGYGGADDDSGPGKIGSRSVRPTI